MNLDQKYIKFFPEHEEIFVGNIDKYRKHFLPICSINLQAIYPEESQWLHFVSVNEIYDGCVGQETHGYHTEYCKDDMIGFNVIGDKYELEADWKYFILEHQSENDQPVNQEDNDNLAGAYRLNQATYDLAKSYYKKHNAIYPFTIGNYFDEVFTLEKLEQDMEDNGDSAEMPEMYGILEDIQFHSKDNISLMNEYNIPLEEMKSFESTNLSELPYDQEGNIFEYIGCFTGYLFQCFGADAAYLFFNKELKKAVMCLEYT